MAALQGELIDIVRRDRARRTRRRKFGDALIEFIGTVIGNGIHALINGWLLMLAVGIVHEYWMPQVPGIGYWWAVLIVYLLRGSFSSARPSKETER